MLRWVPVDLPSALAIAAGSGAQNAIFGWSHGYVAFHESLDGGSVVPWASADGRSWQQGQSLDLAGLDLGVWVEEVAEGPAGLVALGRHPGCADDGLGCQPTPATAIWTSTDGLAWSRLDLQTAFGGGVVGDVSAGSKGYMAVSLSSDADTAAPAVWLSADGRAWRKVALPSAIFGNAYLARGTVQGGGYVVSGRIGSLHGWGHGDFPATTPAVWWSADGSVWSASTLSGVKSAPEAEAAVTKVADGKLVAHVVRWDCSCAPEGVISAWTSSDGRVWKTAGSAFPQGQILSDGRQALMVTSINGVPTVETSDDGFVWERLVVSGSGPADALAAAYGPTGLLVESSGQGLWLAATGAGAS